VNDLLDRMGTKFTVGDGCWLWTGARTSPWGYGTIQLEGRPKRRSGLAHRVMYELIVGPIPEGLVLDHLCRNPSCIRPDHLEPVTQRVNTQRGVRATKTHCAQGHVRDEANTYVRTNGKKMCRVCYLARSRERTRRNQLAR
jgi:hypothetical protein